ncbi:RagB/SusD family nutrient uptake outer membrane protein [Pseudobacter ginsenosidimutans]|uniref:SusD-like starch-binding protein associating with outer membrane n=1 Tax=Pseudobacter ginsenosidimutans TaxID=661488 RepID=A0A4V2F083_9BACT|nr:RagB/SusD family nutrient uptake outer membrane protein [Pseudobacter ginsenosidimutans]QEC40307.1 RagB/SusD family nutrient uptake outer membrane protein [Pseudobacter ginsenosidimutans]RZS69090.1 SusD-like starch-binding protein associating with outer membrane [Pseudobacter ginsenosidimutans]
MSLKIKIVLLICGLTLIGSSSCKKYLDKKSQMGFYVPETPQDLQALLDNNNVMNFQSGTALIELVSDNYFVKPSDWQAAEIFDRDNYIWSETAEDFDTWRFPYLSPIYYSNVVLDALGRVKKVGNEYNDVEGSALFFRSFSFFQLSQLYCKNFSPSADADNGIVLRLNADVESKLARSSVKETYSKIIEDAKKAIELLPKDVVTAFRPNKASAMALLARVYLSMLDYSNALKYADLALKEKNELLDFNNLMSAGEIIPAFAENPEIIFFSSLRNKGLTGRNVAKIDTSLIKSYLPNDLRLNIYFRPNSEPDEGTYRFKGSFYNISNGSVFNGLTTSEMYLIKAECLARGGDVTQAMAELNKLLRKRFESSSFEDLDASSPEAALTIILSERRKELVFRGQRWTDIRRLNLEGHGIELKRIIDGVTYTLLPNDTRTVLLIPKEEIIKSGIEQNIR